MLNYFIYIAVVIILIYVLIIAFKAINRGMEAKKNYDDQVLENIEGDLTNTKNISSEIQKLKKLYDDKVITKNEFEAAKKKILK
tara:strand:- start:490 stop:741 length:252 start_codon:yes stop_codon:yes gene_type:complete